MPRQLLRFFPAAVREAKGQARRSLTQENRKLRLCSLRIPPASTLGPVSNNSKKTSKIAELSSGDVLEKFQMLFSSSRPSLDRSHGRNRSPYVMRLLLDSSRSCTTFSERDAFSKAK